MIRLRFSDHAPIFSLKLGSVWWNACQQLDNLDIRKKLENEIEDYVEKYGSKKDKTKLVRFVSRF